MAVEPKLCFLGFFLSHSMYSGRVFTPMVGETTNTVETVPAMVIGARSLSRS